MVYLPVVLLGYIMNTVQRFEFIKAAIKAIDSNLITMFYSNIKAKRHLDHALLCYVENDCLNSADLLCDELEHLAGYFLTSDQYDQLAEIIRLKELESETNELFEAGDLAGWQALSVMMDNQANHDNFQDTYAMYRDEY
jgi:hypothetical protein